MKMLLGKITVLFLIKALMLIGSSSLALADPAETFIEIQIGKFQDRERAISFAKKAAEKLRYLLSEEIPLNSSNRQRHVGSLIEAYYDQDKNIIVTAYLADSSHGKKSLAYYEQYIRKHYPTAKKVTIRKSQSDIEYAQQYAAYLVSNIIILGSYKNHDQALKEVHRISKASGMPYDSGGLIYHPKKGLIIPEDADHPHAGFYLARRYNECRNNQSTCLSIEISDYYKGFAPGYFIILGGLFPADSSNNALQKTIKKFKKYVPDAYYKQTSIYMGCRS